MRNLIREGERKISSEASDFKLPRKATKRLMVYVPVPQTDTGRQEEYSKTDGRSVVKELGKMTP